MLEVVARPSRGGSTEPGLWPGLRAATFVSHDETGEARCRVAYVRAGRRQSDGEILFETAHGQGAGRAATVARRLAQGYQRGATGLWVEPPIGPDSERAGRRLLDRALYEAKAGGRNQVRVHMPEAAAGEVVSSSVG